MIVVRGELNCFTCGRFLGDFESHPKEHGPTDLHMIKMPGGERPFRPVKTKNGLACSHCGGRAVAQYMDRVAAAPLARSGDA